ncbi:MAG TPA: alpha/beta hydrolase-fold protein, partial [Polyangiaceae bacterium]|nr:alpha/beta hydrolase-fold protein [Polyangiaceae bacterium]
MGRARSRSLSTRSYASLLALFAAREASASEVAILPSAEGRFGAWLAAGPVVMAKAKAPSPIDTAILSGGEDATLSGRLGRPISFVSQGPEAAPAPGPAWRLVSSTQGPIDLAASFNQRGAESFAFLYGVLHLTEPLKGMLLVGASDGVRIYVDRKLVSSSDYPRPERDDEEIIRLDLPAGDHPILMKLHHRDGYWAVRTRVVDETFRAPKGASLRLPGTGDTDARALAAKMTDVDVDRGLSPRGFRPTVRVAFHEGLPRGADRAVHVAVDIRSGGGKPNRVFTVFGGEVPLGESGPSQLNVELPQLTSDDMGDAENGGELAFSIDAGARKVEAVSTLRPFMRQAMVAAADALAALTPDSKAFLADTEITRATVLHLRDRFERYVNAGDGDLEALQADAQTIGEFAADLKARRDPLRRHAGIRRFAYRAPFDGELSPFGVYVPESYANGSAPRDKTYPLVVALHGMNGKPLSMARIFFGHDDEAHDAEWEDRHPGEVDPVDGFVIAPNAYGNAMYRELGEADVINVLDLAEHLFPIDKNRVTITGVSMGGTGAASIALRYPDRFAAAEPLCGYHSYFVRRDLMGRGMWPWEKLLSEQRSNSLWA